MMIAASLLLAALQIQPTFDGVRSAVAAYEAEHPGRTLTVADVLAGLPESYRAGFTMMHTSESIQGAEPGAPRVILFGDDARFVMTFNGRPGQAGYERLETVTANEATGALEFRMIEFPAGDTGSGQARFSVVNPPVCMVCHGGTPHYVWGQYAQWPGAYGSRDDALELTGDELQSLTALRRAAAGHPRYRWLPFDLDAPWVAAPYRRLLDGHEPKDRSDFVFALENRPNARLGMLLTRHQARARVEDMMRAPAFAERKYELAAALAGCDGVADYESVARDLGSDPSKGWHLDKGDVAPEPGNYYAGLTTFRGAVQGQLWPRAFAGDAGLMAFYKPARFATYVRQHDDLGLALTERGRELWEIVDREGDVPTTFAGSEEADFYVESAGMPHLSKAELKTACSQLIRMTLK